MRATTWWTRGRKGIASATALIIAVGVPIGVAAMHRGFPVTDVNLTTRDVWVTNGNDVLAGRLNRQIEELDAAVSAATPSLDVVQNGTDVFLFDPRAGSLERIDPAFTRLTERVDLPSKAIVKLGGTTLAILEPSNGDLWVVDASVAINFDPVDDPTLELGPNAAVAVSPDGTVFATSPADHTLYTIASIGAKPTTATVDFSPEHQLAAVGQSAVILDTDRNMIFRADGSSIDLGSEIGLRLQQSGKDNGYAVVATGDSLLRVSLGSGSIEVGATTISSPVRSSAGVSAPVWLDGCAHGAWGGAQAYLLWCDGADPQQAAIAQPTGNDILEFRVNKSVIALNNLNNGNVWLVDNQMRLVENWDEVTPPLQDQTEEGDQKSSVLSFEDTLAQRSDVNTPPLARDDEFGVRAGRTTILPVIENDSDADGDVLTVTETTAIDPSVGVLDLIDSGRALQFTPTAGTSSASFSYTIDDGRGGVAQAYTNIRVVPQTENTAPVEKRSTTLSVEVGGSVEYNVLTDWADPDGDDLTLVGASPVSGDEARFTPDGFITFTSRTAELGDKEVRLTVSDGVTESTGTFTVTVAQVGTLSPIGAPDYAEVFVGDTVVIEPTLNDIAPSGGRPDLLGLDQIPAGTTVTPSLDTGKVSFSSPTAGTFYFLYSLGAGSATSVGIVRVDVRPNPEVALPPIAVKDTAYLRPGEPTLVKVLANDVSPAGLVLAVQQVDTSSTDGALTIEVLNNTTVRITATNALVNQTQFTYTVSDGAQSALAGVTVVPVPPIVNRQPPVAVDDTINVRAGDYVSVDVLANDYHPDDSQVLLEQTLADTTKIGANALAFVNDQKVRYQAPSVPGEYSLIYRIADQYGESATASVTFSVIAPVDNVNDNRPPAPEPQIARVFSGASVPITVPLDGIDPDGDSVLLSQITVPGTKGSVSKQTLNSFVYTASASDAGTDTVYYEVEDTYGAKAIGRISIGVIPRLAQADPPSAVDDTVEIRPGRTASVQVLLNDSDPAGYPLQLTELTAVDTGIDARIEGDAVVITAPDTEGSFSMRYGIDNGNGGVDTAFILVSVTKDAAPQYPVATDYYVPVDDVVSKDTVVVDLAGLIANPAGRAADLVVTVDGPNAKLGTVDQATQTITVKPSDRRVAIAYTVTNPDDGLSGSAFIIVPPAVSANFAYPPYLDPNLPEQIVDMNGTMEWNLDDILIVPSGRQAILTDKSAASATNSNGDSVYVDAHTLRFTPVQNYRGIAALTFTVTDGANKDDINGLQSTITLPVQVGNPDFTDTAPVFTAQNVTIEAGNPATEIDLRASTTHPNPSLISQFGYTDLSGTTSDIDASINGGTLSVSSPLGVQPNTKTVLTFVITYKDFRVPGTVTVTTVPSTKPYPVANQDDDKGQRSVTPLTFFNVLDNDINPFGADKPLTVTQASIVSAGTGATLEWHPDGRVKVVPGPTFHGYIDVQYTVQDATLEPSRKVTGTYRLNVRDRPDKMVAPVASPGDHTATVTWTAPETNGEPITSYTVTWTPPQGSGAGSYTTVSPTEATLTVTGLTNGTDYTFRVTATNVLGTSDVSNVSNAARPKGQATAPTSVGVTGSTDGSGTISMNWSGAGANGGDITGYTVSIYQGAGSTVVGTVSSVTTSASWQGTVGVAYTYTVVAKATGGDSVNSARSAPASPAPGQPSVSLSAPGAAGNYTLNGSYGAAAANGVAPGSVSYTWTLSSSLGSGSQAAPYSLSATGTASKTYTLTVTATVNGVSNSNTASAKTPAAPVTTWSANAPVGTCPEQRSGSFLTPTHYNPSGPSCSSAHGFVNGAITVYCYNNYTTSSGPGPWYEFSGDGYTRGEGWLVKGDTISVSGSPPLC